MFVDNMANNYIPSNAKLISCLIILTQGVVCTAPRYFLVVLRCEFNETATRCAKPKNCNTCELRGNCNYRCKVDCDCVNGYYRNKFGKCISASECISSPVCPPNETHSDCVNPCNDCQIRGKCNFLVCNKGCDCIKGYHRDSNGKCIPANTCPDNQCPPNEMHSDCVNPCNDCQIRGNCNFLLCNKGCDCIEGYHRDSNGKCIPANNCPDNPPTCGKNEVYNECGTACPATCSNNPQGCSEQCVKGCFCKDGFVRNDQGECIEPEKCPQECGLNEEIVKCAKPKTCNTCEIRGNCSLKRCIKGCDCISGYFRNKSGICIPESECPRTCGKDEIYQECGTACPDTCSNLGKNRACTLQCVPGCFCREGLVRNESNNKCVKPEECPQEPNKTCGPGEEYYDCIPTCKNTCENCNDEHPICSRLCKPGCACKKGLVKRKDGKCVLPEDCEIPPS